MLLKTLIIRLVRLCILAIVHCSILARADYTYFNSAAGSDVLVQEMRWPYWNANFYDTWLSQWWQSAEGTSGYYYSGLPNPATGSSNPVTHGINWSFWPLSSSVNIADTIVPSYTGPNTYSQPTIGEGTICTAPGSYSFWRTNVWYRMAFRTWLPVDGTPHKGYAGEWLRDPVTGIWYHHGTMQLPFAVTGIGGQMGFQELFTGGSVNTNRVDHRYCYYHLSGGWNSANQFRFDTAGSAGLIETNTAVFSESGTANSYVANTWLTLTQPATPNFLIRFWSQIMVRPSRATNCWCNGRFPTPVRLSSPIGSRSIPTLVTPARWPPVFTTLPRKRGRNC